MKRIGLLLGSTACAIVLLTGCSASAGSEEWRLRNLEEGFLQFKETERQQEADMKDLSARIAVLEERLTQAEERLLVLDGQQPAMTTIKPMDTPEPPAVMSGSAPSATSPMPPNVSEKNAYDRAVKLAMAENYEAARDALTTFLERWPDGEHAPNAMYWLGETYYGEQRYAQSILTFKDVLAKYPKHHKASDALLKIGFAYDKLQDPANAKFYLQTLLDEYPKSEAAPKARAKLRELGQ